MDNRTHTYPNYLAIIAIDRRMAETSTTGNFAPPNSFCLSYFTHAGTGDPLYMNNNDEWFSTLHDAYRALVVRRGGDGFTTAHTLTVNAMMDAVADEIIDTVGALDGTYTDYVNQETSISSIQLELMMVHGAERDLLIGPPLLRKIVEHRSALA